MVSCRNLTMASNVALLVLATVLCVASYAEGQILFSKLPKSLIVTATMPGGGPITGNLNPSLDFREWDAVSLRIICSPIFPAILVWDVGIPGQNCSFFSGL